jgi:hypothetical protein
MVGTFDGRDAVGHSGATWGFMSDLYHFPKVRLSVVICFSVDPATESAANLLSTAQSGILGEVLLAS